MEQQPEVKRGITPRCFSGTKQKVPAAIQAFSNDFVISQCLGFYEVHWEGEIWNFFQKTNPKRLCIKDVPVRPFYNKWLTKKYGPFFGKFIKTSGWPLRNCFDAKNKILEIPKVSAFHMLSSIFLVEWVSKETTFSGADNYKKATKENTLIGEGNMPESREKPTGGRSPS